jgi:hypothetical protein
MKAFIISVSTLGLILCLAIINSIYIYNVTNSLIADAEGLRVDDESVIEFKERWEGLQTIIKITSSHKETHRIDEVVGVLFAKKENGTVNGFEEEKALLVEYLVQIQEDERVSLDSVI